MNMENNIKILNIDDILPNRFQPRIQFSDKNLSELADSIKEHGVIQPIVVRKISDKYEIIAGERRYKASILAGKTTIPAIITDLNDKDSAEIALIENVQRQDLTPIEEAISYKKILDMGYITQTELADKLGKTQSTIANKLRLLNLDDEVQEALLDGKISERHARSLLRLDDKNQVNMLSRIINERLTVRKTDEEVDKILNNSDSGEQKEIIDKKVDNKMNEEIKNEFNIPTNPIYNEEIKPVEPIVTNTVSNNIESTESFNSFISNQPELQPSPFNEEIKPVEPIVTNTVSNNIEPTESFNSFVSNQPEPQPSPFNEEIESNRSFINPGFMDIEKIENSAEDIFVTREPANMNSLLEAKTPQPEQVSSMASIPEEEPVQKSAVGKFFNMFRFNQPEENPDYVENVEKEETNLDFGIPKRENTAFNPFNISNNEPEPLSTNLSEIPNNVKNTQTFEMPTNEVNNEVFGQPEFKMFDNLTEVPVPEKETFNTDLITPEESLPRYEQERLEEKEELFTSINPYHLNEDSDFTIKIPVNEINENLNSTVEQPQFEEIPFMEEMKNEEVIEVPSTYENQNKFVASDFKTVINTIRECSATIQKYGYKVEVEEIDFEDKYQVVFNIEK